MFHSHGSHWCWSPRPRPRWASQALFSPKGHGNHLAKCYKGTTSTSWFECWNFCEKQTPASECSCSRHCRDFHPRTLGGLQTDTLGGCGGTFCSILKYFSASGLHVTIRFCLLTRHLFSFVQNRLAGSPPRSSRFKANAQDIPKATGTALGFAKLFCDILMKTHYASNGEKIP